MEITIPPPPPSEKKEHPSIVQRRKLEAARKERLTKALRENLRKRKEQAHNRLEQNDG